MITVFGVGILVVEANDGEGLDGAALCVCYDDYEILDLLLEDVSFLSVGGDFEDTYGVLEYVYRGRAIIVLRMINDVYFVVALAPFYV